MITLLYGQPGTGKSTLATGVMLEYLGEGRRVVSNYAIDPAPASGTPWGVMASAVVEVIPSRPDVAHLEALGLGWRDSREVGREDRSALLVVDEAGPWLDSRKWNDAQRPKLIDWLLHSRKRGYDVLLIAQAPTLLDKQVREAVVEAYARCRRTDRMMVPGTRIRLPRVHVAVARYGLDAHAPVLQRWAYRGAVEHQCFDSYALFDAVGGAGWYSTLPPRLTRWRVLSGVWAWLDGWRRPGPHRRPVRRQALRQRHPAMELVALLPAELRVAEARRLLRLGVV